MTPVEAALIALWDRMGVLEKRVAAQLVIIEAHELRIEQLEWTNRSLMRRRAE